MYHFINDHPPESVVSGRVFRKREFSWIRPETFGNFRPEKCERGSPETFEGEKSPHLAGLSRQEKEILQKPECVADHAGFELAYSRLEKGL
jgi:hypothetical protein